MFRRQDAFASLQALRPSVDEYITVERVRRYFSRFANTPAPSTAASGVQGPGSEKSSSGRRCTAGPDFHLCENFENTGAVTPPHLYALAREFTDLLSDLGVRVQQSNNAYTSRSDDVSVTMKTSNALLLGFPGFNRHYDRDEPRANLTDIVHLAKARVYFSVMRPFYHELQRQLSGTNA